MLAGHSLNYPRDGRNNISTTTTTHISARRVTASHEYFLPLHSDTGRGITVKMAVQNFSRVRSGSGIAAPNPDSPTGQHLRSSPAKAFGVKRWNGETRAISDWDGLRRVSIANLHHCLRPRLTVVS